MAYTQPPQPAPPQPEPPQRTLPGWLKARIVGLVVFIIGVVTGSSGDPVAQDVVASDDSPAPTVTHTVPAPPAATKTVPGPTKTVPGPRVTVTVTAPPAAPVGIPEDGLWHVGTDVKPGTYRSRGEDCYWARSAGSTRFTAVVPEVRRHAHAVSDQLAREVADIVKSL
jgi:hypothetical protein